MNTETMEENQNRNLMEHKNKFRSEVILQQKDPDLYYIYYTMLFIYDTTILKKQSDILLDSALIYMKKVIYKEHMLLPITKDKSSFQQQKFLHTSLRVLQQNFFPLIHIHIKIKGQVFAWLCSPPSVLGFFCRHAYMQAYLIKTLWSS